MKLQYDNIEKFKYRLTALYSFKLPVPFPIAIYPLFAPNDWLSYNTRTGIITYEEGYAWDGSSGPTIDSKKCQLAGLVHDGAYQMLREGVFGNHEYKEAARKYFDDLYREMCISAGMGRRRAWLRWKGLRWFGKRASNGN